MHRHRHHSFHFECSTCNRVFSHCHIAAFPEVKGLITLSTTESDWGIKPPVHCNTETLQWEVELDTFSNSELHHSLWQYRECLLPFIAEFPTITAFHLMMPLFSVQQWHRNQNADLASVQNNLLFICAYGLKQMNQTRLSCSAFYKMIDLFLIIKYTRDQHQDFFSLHMWECLLEPSVGPWWWTQPWITCLFRGIGSYLSVSVTGMRGLRNYCLSCCVNTLLQSFSATWELADLLDK